MAMRVTLYASFTVRNAETMIMKYLLIIFLLIISTFSRAQKNSLVGEWKIVSIDNGEIFYNVKNDSISVSPEFTEEDLDMSQLAHLKKITRITYGNTMFSFDAEGNFSWVFMHGVATKSKYEIDERKQSIKLTGKNDLGQAIVDEFPYKLKNGLLYFTITFQEPYGTYVLEKADN